MGFGEEGPPEPAEVRAYFEANMLRGDPGEFFDHFAAQGWTRSNGMPVLDWRAQARMWDRKQREIDGSRPPDPGPPPAPSNMRDYEAELAAIDAELAGRGIVA